ncbi:MAG: hypothetical protein AAFY58_05355 [Planctomycetota bacterium]
MHYDNVTEFSIYLADKPGALAGVLEAATIEGVHVQAVTVGDSHGSGLIRLVGNDAEALRQVCEQLVHAGGGPVTEATVLAVDVSERPNAFRDIVSQFASDGVNVKYAYQAPQLNGSPARCIFRVEEPDMATKSLDTLG